MLGRPALGFRVKKLNDFKMMRITWIPLLFSACFFVREIQADNPNQLIRSGGIEQIADAVIMTQSGIRFSVGDAQQIFFSETDRVLQSLTAAAQASNGIVAPGWTVSSQFEEWTDRLVLKKSVTFDMIDGGALNSGYLNQDGAGFVAAASVENGSGAALTQGELLQKAEAFIASGGHLQLYPQAQVAGTQGAQALMDELAVDRGPVTITETIVFGRIIPQLSDVSEAASALGDRLGQQPSESNIPTVSGPGLDMLGKAMVQRAPYISSQAPIIAGGLSRASYSADMLNGFTVGEDWSREIHYNRSWIKFKTSVFATFGLGLRIPWKAGIETSPRYISSEQPDHTRFDATMSVETKNADVTFYRSVGLPDDRLYDGQELVIRAGAGITLKVELFGETLVNRGRSDPLVGKNLDLGSHFDPPMNGASAAAGSPTLLYEDTGLAWQNWFIGIGCDMRANVSLTGDGLDLDLSPHNSWMVSPFGGALSRSTRGYFFARENEAGTINLAVDDTSTAQTTRGGKRYYQHGILLSNASYKVDMDVVPQARLRCTLKLSNIIHALDDINLSTPWISLFTANFDLPELGPHAYTDDEIQAWDENRRYLPNVSLGGHIQRHLTQSTDNAGTWSISLTEESKISSGVLKEFVPLGFSVGQILGGGVYNAADGCITWQLDSSSLPAQVGYTLTGPAGQSPALLGQWQAQGQGQPSPTLAASQKDGGDPSLPLLVRELSQRPTLQQVVDGRAGSVLLTADPDNKVRLRLQVETSEDLQTWSTTPESQTSPLEVVYPMAAGKRFFRFKLKD